MTIREAIAMIFVGYGPAKSQAFAGHPVARVTRHDFPDAVRAVIPEERYLIEGSAGQGQCAGEVTRGERRRRGRNRRVHLNPATLVTLTVQCPILIYLATTNQHVVSRTERTTKDTRRGEERTTQFYANT
jgi:5-methylcytosine-specific restriction enzyme MrcB-like protein